MRKKGQKWTYELLHKTALKYKTRSEFRKGNPNAYRASHRHGIFKDICSHMKSPFYRMEGTPYVKWTNEMLFAEARKYKTRHAFRSGSVSAYDASQRREILEDVCSHMKKLPHWDKPHCVYLIEIFSTNNELCYYVGQTSELENRLYEHFCNKGSYSPDRRVDSPVSDFLSKTPIYYKKHYIVKDNLTYKESIELERDTIKDLKDRGIKLLNKKIYTM